MLSIEQALKVAPLRRKLVFSQATAAIYALATNAARLPEDRRDMQLVTGAPIPVLPGLATVLMAGASPLFDLGIDLSRILHGEQRLEMHRTLQAGREYLISERVKGLFDKGEGRDAIVILEKSIVESDGGALASLSISTAIVRGGGGFGGLRDGAPAPHPIPERAPDIILPCETRPEQAALFSLLGDTNPLHLDIEAARRAGFERPILHGLCTYGIACHALLGAFLSYEPGRVRTLDVRYAAPVFPGDRLELDAWIAGSDISFRMRCPERDSVVLSNGYFQFKD